MSTLEVSSSDAGAVGVGRVGVKLEVVVIPVSDVDRAKGFYGRLDADFPFNGWLLQEVTTRLPGRIDRAETAFSSASELASALTRAEVAHGEHEQRTGQRDVNWPDWYAAYMVAEQASEELPT